MFSLQNPHSDVSQWYHAMFSRDRMTKDPKSQKISVDFNHRTCLPFNLLLTRTINSTVNDIKAICMQNWVTCFRAIGS